MTGKPRILVVDDETQVTDLMRAMLERTGKYEVQEAHGGQLALEMAQTFRPDLILLDIIMPDVDGSEVAQQLKNDTEFQHIPIIFLTAAVTQEEVAAQRGVIGGHPFLAKPVDMEQVLALIEEHIG